MNLNRVESFLRTSIGTIENMVIDFISELVPWLAPLPSAALVSRAVITYLGFGTIMGVVSAIIIEFLGLTSISTSLTIWNYNENRRKQDKPAPFFLSLGLVGFYLVSTIGLTVFLDTFPTLAHFAPALFPFLALVGGLNLVLKMDHRNRLKRLSDEKAERHDRRQEIRQTTTNESENLVTNNVSNHRKSNTNLDILQSGRKAKVDTNLNKTFDIFKLNPTTPITDAARVVGVSRTTIYTYLDELEEQKRIKRNGHGIEIITD